MWQGLHVHAIAVLLEPWRQGYVLVVPCEESLQDQLTVSRSSYREKYQHPWPVMLRFASSSRTSGPPVNQAQIAVLTENEPSHRGLQHGRPRNRSGY